MTLDPGDRMTPHQSMAWLLAPLMAGAAVSVALGVYGSLHQPTGIAVNVSGFSSQQTVKVWLASGAAVLAVVQLVSALVMYGKLPGVRGPYWIGTLHRWSGRLAFLLTVPVAVHCLYALGFQAGEPRVLVHSLFGCFFYGAFAAKMLVLRADTPKWTLPVLGGAVFSALTALWLTASVWFFATSGLTF
jgi:hypothetical protein